MRTKYQQSDAGGPQKEIAELRSRLVDVESRLARERAIHHELMTEKEHFRLAAHKLVSSFRFALVYFEVEISLQGTIIAFSSPTLTGKSCSSRKNKAEKFTISSGIG